MKYGLFFIFLSLPLCGSCHGAELEFSKPLDKLEFFVGKGSSQAEIKALIDRLDDDSYQHRHHALDQLTNLPMLPKYVRQLAEQDPRPEVRSRLQDLTKHFSAHHESTVLNKTLKQISDQNIQGALPPLISVVESKLWQLNSHTLYQAARVTIRSTDLALIQRHIASPSDPVRALIAASLAGTKPKDAIPLLQQLLIDRSDKVQLQAALSLAKFKHHSCLAALIKLLNSPSFAIRHRSWSVLKSLSGKSFGYDPSSENTERLKKQFEWRRWSNNGKAKKLADLPDNQDIALFNGENLAGWDVYENGRLVKQARNWKVAAGELRCLGGQQGDIRSRQRFENYVLVLEYQINQAAGDGGIGIMLTQENEAAQANPKAGMDKYLEVQLLPGKTGDLYTINGFAAQANGQPINFSSPRTAQIPDPVGKWNQLKLSVSNGSVKVELNGKIVNQAASGSKGPGKIVLRNEGHAISYRNMVIYENDSE